jgi:hypothetical protein
MIFKTKKSLGWNEGDNSMVPLLSHTPTLDPVGQDRSPMGSKYENFLLTISGFGSKNFGPDGL